MFSHQTSTAADGAGRAEPGVLLTVDCNRIRGVTLCTVALACGDECLLWHFPAMASLVVLPSLLDCSFAATADRDANVLSAGRTACDGSGDAMPFSEASAAAASSARKVKVRFRPDLDTDGVAACAAAARPM